MSVATIAKGLRWIGMPVFLGSTMIGTPLMAVATPFIMLPTLALLYKRHTLPRDRQADLNSLTYIYFGSIFGIAGVILAQLLLVHAIAKPLFGDQAATFMVELVRSTVGDLTPDQLVLRGKIASSWQYWVLLVAMTYVAAGGVEELLKYAPIAYLHRRQRQSADKKAIPKEVYLQYAVAAGLGFSTIENVAFARVAVKVGESGWKLALTIFERVVGGTIGHCLMAALIAVNVAKMGEYRRTPRNLWRILGGPILWHGSFDLVLFGLSALEGNVGFIHPEDPWRIAGMILVAESIQLSLFLQVRRRWLALGE
ncbi:hypothetical protein LTR91_017413 [Friedmanniomyces endolithicus]|uniref:PrsW family intramembrane metalloprotease n=1 Tax=Friedmanniomyces endolithicus TaxID=329885 RepID=A0AAN6G244_9PEZI|nr:hypothetical protein LTR35_003179 [Friedmanniomyces endolithicus]KAK0300548.1 hypothetical protein LTS00_000804 [Friedmanniomyces endolithicus]KAK0328408.1 hypothetical protein LTR82_000338 [Friedmanniomyces endolithicus]KAK0925299.1 hypothetical protein LTR57_004949 [Friedmanniomyces endolithicus]KAK0966855.1 hypothetical protein LTR91_017413 [Friedmanniomyces endolithicus]